MIATVGKKSAALFDAPEIPTWLESEDYTDENMAVDAIPAWKKAIELMAETDLGDKAVLDFGCNRGGFLRMLYGQRPFRYGLGVDVAMESLAAARRETAPAQPIEFAHVTALAGHESRFDVAQSHWVIFHFERLAEHARQMRHVLKAGGIYYFHSGEHTESRAWQRWKPMLEKRIGLPTYTHAPDDCIRAFEEEGFEVEVRPWTWTEMAFMEGFTPTVWHPTVEDYQDHYMNRLLMFRARLKSK